MLLCRRPFCLLLVVDVADKALFLPLLSGDCVPNRLIALLTRFWRKRGSNVVDVACDALTDRFSILPVHGDEGTEDDPQDRHPAGPDCRNYFRGFLTYVEHMLDREPATGALATEARTAHAMQRFAKRHFYLCMRDALREINPLVSRYAWEFNGATYNLWFPKTLSGRKRGEWLEEHISKPREGNPWEEQRIQAIIDERLGVPRLTSLDACLDRIPLASTPIPSPRHAAMDAEGKRIRHAIADEKAGLIHTMRPAIRDLGPAGLRSLVLKILTNLDEPCESHAEIAREAGLSCSTLSRFAGEQWRHQDGRAVPDLWRNIAHIAARTPAFVEAAKDMGLFQTIADTLEEGDSGMMEKDARHGQ